MRAFEVGTDDRGVREDLVAVAERGDAPERAHLPELRGWRKRRGLLLLEGQILLGEHDFDFSDERGRVGAKQFQHRVIPPGAWARRAPFGFVVKLVLSA